MPLQPGPPNTAEWGAGADSQVEDQVVVSLLGNTVMEPDCGGRRQPLQHPCSTRPSSPASSHLQATQRVRCSGQHGGQQRPRGSRGLRFSGHPQFGHHGPCPSPDCASWSTGGQVAHPSVTCWLCDFGQWLPFLGSVWGWRRRDSQSASVTHTGVQWVASVEEIIVLGRRGL